MSEEREAKKCATGTLDRMHHVLIEEILPRLPVKSLIRFKCVCKDWLHTISSNSFAHSYLRASSPSHQIIIHYKNHECDDKKHMSFSLLIYDEESDEKKLVNLGQNYPGVSEMSNFNVVGSSCNGLLCLRPKPKVPKKGFFRVWNPTTQVHRDIFYPYKHYICWNICGLGYVSSMDDYRIVCFFKDKKNLDVHVYVFSLRVGNWKRVSSVHNRKVRINSCDETSVPLGLDESEWVGDSLFWVVRETGQFWAKNILRFDLVGEKFSEIPLIDNHGNALNVYRSGSELTVINGCLSILTYSYKEGRNVWMLKQPGVWDLWEKVLFPFPHRDVSLLRWKYVESLVSPFHL